jgi:hypothetical protein
MLSDRTIGGRWPGAAHMDVPAGTPPFFWRVADGNYDSRTLNSTGGWIADDYRWQPGVVQSDGAMTTNHGSQWYVDAENIYPMAGMDHGNALARRVGLSSGNRWLVVAGVDPQAMPEQGIGYWSAWLGALSGATTRVTLKLRGQNLAPAGDGGAVVWLEFLNATSRGRQRQYLVGRDEQGVVHRGALTAGSYDWTTVDETIVVPGEAVRMALFMGLKPAAGAVHFDDIDIKTDDYRAPDLLYYLPFQDLATGLVSLNVYDGNSNVVATVSPSTLWQAPGPWGIDRTIPAGKGWTTNSPAGTGWAYDLAIDPTNRPVEGPGLTLRGCTLYTNLQLSVTNEAITIAMWVLLHGYDAFSSTYQGLVNNNRRTDGANGWAFGLRDTASSTNAHTDPAQLYFTLGGGRGVRFSGTTTRVPVGAWTHVAVTWKAGAGNPAFYVNGVDAGTGSGSSDLSTKVAIPDTPPFGGSLMLSLNDAQYIPGNVIMDEVRIYQRALTPAEILVLSQTK